MIWQFSKTKYHQWHFRVPDVSTIFRTFPPEENNKRINVKTSVVVFTLTRLFCHSIVRFFFFPHLEIARNGAELNGTILAGHVPSTCHRSHSDQCLHSDASAKNARPSWQMHNTCLARRFTLSLVCLASRARPRCSWCSWDDGNYNSDDQKTSSVAGGERAPRRHHRSLSSFRKTNTAEHNVCQESFGISSALKVLLMTF